MLENFLLPDQDHGLGHLRIVSADLSGLLLAVLGVAVLLSLLGTGLHLQLASEASHIIPLLSASASLLVPTGLLRLVGPDKPALHHTYRLRRLLLHHHFLLLFFLGSMWLFCFSTGSGKMLENFS